MKYENYTVDDFLMDESFRRWVLDRDRTGDLFWEKWIETHPEKAKIIKEATEIILAVEFDKKEDFEIKTIEMWERLRDAMEAHSNENQGVTTLTRQGTSKEGRKAFNSALFYKMAAAFVGILSLAAVYYFTFLNSDREFRTSYGEIRTFTLPDSSIVTLNGNSTLTFREDWNPDDPREVSIDGEAFFHILKKPRRSSGEFVVHSNRMDVEVLGTKFNVNNRRGKTTVVLKAGKVKLKREEVQSDSLIMKPGELAEFNEASGRLTSKHVETEVYTSWTNNRLIFDGVAVSEIVMIMEDNYGYDVSFEDSAILQRKFKGTFPADQPNILLTALAESFNLRLVQEDNRILFLAN